jgi:hypothetical protein
MGISSFASRAMDELIFTNLGWPKVTPYQARWDTATWALFTETWPSSIETLIIVRQGNDSRSRAFLFSAPFQK